MKLIVAVRNPAYARFQSADLAGLHLGRRVQTDRAILQSHASDGREPHFNANANWSCLHLRALYKSQVVAKVKFGKTKVKQNSNAFQQNHSTIIHRMTHLREERGTF